MSLSILSTHNFAIHCTYVLVRCLPLLTQYVIYGYDSNLRVIGLGCWKGAFGCRSNFLPFKPSSHVTYDNKRHHQEGKVP